jgi:hypothetical protein
MKGLIVAVAVLLVAPLEMAAAQQVTPPLKADHGAAGDLVFARKFGGCMETFVDKGSGPARQGYGMYEPPLTCSTWPVMASASSEARNTALRAIWSGAKSLPPSGMVARAISISSASVLP